MACSISAFVRPPLACTATAAETKRDSETADETKVSSTSKQQGNFSDQRLGRRSDSDCTCFLIVGRFVFGSDCDDVVRIDRKRDLQEKQARENNELSEFVRIAI